MRYISICSGIEAATGAWKPLGWEAVAFAEIDAFPSAVLAHHYPDVPNLGDITQVDWRPYRGAVDLVVGGTPCQSLSIAGKREGLDGASGLIREYFRLLSEVQPRWFVWENVPGAFSSHGGADYKSILREWDKLGYSVAWRVLDAAFMGVPQRRRRIFAVGHFGDWRNPAKVLFEQESVRWDPKKSGKERKKVAKNIVSGVEKCLNRVKAFAQNGLGEVRCGDMVGSLCANSNPSGRNTPMIVLNDQGGSVMHVEETCTCPTLRAQTYGHEPCIVHCAKVAPTIGASGPPYARTGNERVETEALAVMAIRTAQTSSNGCGVSEDGMAYTLDGTAGQAVLPFAQNSRDEVRILPPMLCEPMPINTQVATRHKALGRGTGFGVGEPGDPAYTLQAGHSHAIAEFSPRLAVRRLTPTEAERLQGFPDGYTDIPYRGKDHAPDTARYKSLGNSMCVPCMRWIGERIQKVERGK